MNMPKTNVTVEIVIRAGNHRVWDLEYDDEVELDDIEGATRLLLNTAQDEVINKLKFVGMIHE